MIASRATSGARHTGAWTLRWRIMRCAYLCFSLNVHADRRADPCHTHLIVEPPHHLLVPLKLRPQLFQLLPQVGSLNLRPQTFVS